MDHCAVPPTHPLGRVLQASIKNGRRPVTRAGVVHMSAERLGPPPPRPARRFAFHPELVRVVKLHCASSLVRLRPSRVSLKRARLNHLACQLQCVFSCYHRYGSVSRREDCLDVASFPLVNSSVAVSRGLHGARLILRSLLCRQLIRVVLLFLKIRLEGMCQKVLSAKPSLHLMKLFRLNSVAAGPRSDPLRLSSKDHVCHPLNKTHR